MRRKGSAHDHPLLPRRKYRKLDRTFEVRESHRNLSTWRSVWVKHNAVIKTPFQCKHSLSFDHQERLTSIHPSKQFFIFIPPINTLAFPSLPPLINTYHPTRSQDGKSPRHPQTIPHNVQFTATDFLPSYGYFRDFDTSRCALGKHQHFNIEDPAFGMHVRNDMREGGSRKEFESALGVADA